jgi:ABC-type bacteriocin/lantibiotic exporter with double-glycine peptidase domain
MVLVFPAVTKRVIDEVLVQHRPERLTPLILMAALAVFGISPRRLWV